MTIYKISSDSKLEFYRLLKDVYELDIKRLEFDQFVIIKGLFKTLIDLAFDGEFDPVITIISGWHKFTPEYSPIYPVINELYNFLDCAIYKN